MDAFAGFNVAFRVHSRHMYPSEKRDRTVAVDLPHAARERAVLRLSSVELMRAQGSSAYRSYTYALSDGFPAP